MRRPGHGSRTSRYTRRPVQRPYSTGLAGENGQVSSNVCAGAASGKNRMSLGLDPIVSSLFYSLSLIPHLKRPERGTAPSNRESAVLPYVSVLVTFCQETRADTEMTVSSFLAQTYPA